VATPLRLLIVEDSPEDAALIGRFVEHGGYAVTLEVVDSEGALRAALAGKDWDVITSDRSMPHFSAPAARECRFPVATTRPVGPERKVGRRAAASSTRPAARIASAAC